jgi:hypothetical protein
VLAIIVASFPVSVSSREWHISSFLNISWLQKVIIKHYRKPVTQDKQNAKNKPSEQLKISTIY